MEIPSAYAILNMVAFNRDINLIIVSPWIKRLHKVYDLIYCLPYCTLNAKQFWSRMTWLHFKGYIVKVIFEAISSTPLETHLLDINRIILCVVNFFTSFKSVKANIGLVFVVRRLVHVFVDIVGAGLCSLLFMTAVLILGATTFMTAVLIPGASTFMTSVVIRVATTHMTPLLALLDVILMLGQRRCRQVCYFFKQFISITFWD